MGMFVWNTFLCCLAILMIVGTIAFMIVGALALYKFLDEETDLIDYLKDKWKKHKENKENKNDSAEN